MEYQIENLETGEIIRVEARGVLEESALNRIDAGLYEAASEHGCERVLYDLREAELDLSSAEIYFRPKSVSSLGNVHHFKIAIVYSQDEEKYQFVELTAQNKGFTLKVFKNYDDAIPWLEGQ